MRWWWRQRYAVPAVSLRRCPAPLALRLIVGEQHQVGRDVGLIVATNIAGGIVGTMLTGFVMIPALGLVRTLAILTILATAIGAIATLFAVSRKSQVIAAAIAIATTGFP